MHPPKHFNLNKEKMKKDILKDILNRFDHFIKNVDFDNLPEQESEDYRELLMQTANDGIFCDGRYSANTEYTLEVFENPDYASESRSLAAINALSEKDRVRFRFYLDLKDMCYPLFRGKKTEHGRWREQLGQQGAVWLHNRLQVA